MRDLQQWKDKVELSLDGRQLFFLFFGGATLACLLFTLGVMTGRRIEARAIAIDAPTTEDPLAALDQLGDLEDDDLTYHRALTGSTRPAKPATRGTLPAKPVEAASPKKADAKPEAKPDMKSATKHAALPVEQAPAKAEAATTTVQASVVTPVAAPMLRSGVKDADGSKEGSPKESAISRDHFTLQLSAFAARRDADDFMHRVQSAGYRAFVIASDVPGKGVLYRVRVGDYASRDTATMEKLALEKKLHVSAYLAKL